MINSLTDREAYDLQYEWRGFWARPSQLLPGTAGAAIDRSDWRYWIPKAGRGWGKTRVGAETCREWANDPGARILLVGATTSDVREVMIEGPSGLLSCYPPHERPIYNPSRHLITFPSGAIGMTRSADEPERLRGPQFTKFWVDELCAWSYVEQAWQQLAMGFRLKSAALQGLITTTPKPIDLFKQLLKHPKSVVTHGTSHENKANLAEDWYKDVISPYEGTRIGRQEIYGEVLDDTEGALWTRDMIEACRVDSAKVPEIVRIVVAVDPATTAKKTSDMTGIGVVGLGRDGHCYVYADYTLKATVGDWVRKVCWAWGAWKADRIVAEGNNGGDLVEHAIRGVSPLIPYRSVHASRGKMMRAEPVAALYEQRKVHHIIGRDLKDLEEQMVSWVPGVTEKSPDRIDWLVWAIYDLVLQPAEQHATAIYEDRVQISPY